MNPPNSRSLLVHNLPPAFQKDNLKALFESLGKVDYADILV